MAFIYCSFHPASFFYLLYFSITKISILPEVEEFLIVLCGFSFPILLLVYN